MTIRILPAIKASRLRLIFFALAFGLFATAFLTEPSSGRNISLYYHEELKKLKEELKDFKLACSQKLPLKKLQQLFISARIHYKKLAVILEFFSPYESRFLNGPAIKRVEDDNPKVIIDPHGFQVMEELLFGSWSGKNYTLLCRELAFSADMVEQIIKAHPPSFKFRREEVFEAFRSSMIRLMTLGISGYDSPVALHSIEEASATLSGLLQFLSFYESDIKEQDPLLFQTIQELISKADLYLLGSGDFVSFDRMYFIRRFADPLFGCFSKAKIRLQLTSGQGRKAISDQAFSLFSENSFDISFFAPDAQYALTPERIDLGRQLFYDPVLSENRQRSCASCHRPELAFTDGLRVPVSVDGKTLLKRNTPTLWNSVYQTKLFYDSRTDLLENQLVDVVHNVEEMKGSLITGTEIIRTHPEYNELFRKAYAGQKDPVSPYNIANAISSYVRSLVALNSRFDQYMRGNDSSMSASEIRGFNLFMGKAKCGTCHFVPLFNGLLPPDFNETESEVLGIPEKAGRRTLDTDPGKFNFTFSEVDRNSFKTPTIRNVTFTAPYMHNGVFKTLSQVVRFYNNGGGRILKDPLPNQTLPMERLHLTASERNDIVAFMKSLSDTSYQTIKAGPPVISIRK